MLDHASAKRIPPRLLWADIKTEWMLSTLAQHCEVLTLYQKKAEYVREPKTIGGLLGTWADDLLW